MSSYPIGETRPVSNDLKASFWLPNEAEATAFILPDRSSVIYRMLSQRTAAFATRLPAKRD